MQRLQRLAVNDRGFAFDPVTGCSFTLNTSGSLVLDALREGRSPSEAAAQVAERYRLPAVTAAADVQAFLSNLTELGLVTAEDLA